MRISLSDRALLCVDWDERSLRVVEATVSRSGVRLRKAVHVPLASGLNVRDSAAMGEFLNRALREHRIRTRKVLVDVPRQDAILNMLSLPDGTTDELAAMVNVQVAKELPFSKDQAIIDFAVMREKGSKTCDVWAAAIRSHVIEYYKETIEAAGLTLERVGLRPYANQAAVVESGDVAGRTVLVDIGPSMTEINIIRDARLVYSRAASVSVTAGLAAPEEVSDVADEDLIIPPAEELLPKQGPLDALLIEVSRTIQAYRATDPGARIDRVLLSGTGGVDERTRDAFARRFGISAHIFQAPAPLQWDRVTDVSAAPFIAVIGLALGIQAQEIARFDFLHPKEPEAGIRERKKRIPMTAAVVVLFLAAGGVYAIQTLRNKDKSIQEVVVKANELDRDLKARESLRAKYQDVSKWKKEAIVWVDELRLLAENFVSNQRAYIRGFSLKEKGEIRIDLKSKDVGVGPQLADAIRKIKRKYKDESGKEIEEQVFDATVGRYEEDKSDPKYPFNDEVIVQVRRLKADKRAGAGR